ncbi:MAG: EamA family transporter [Chthonomonadales bacterium]|nr:EamA family transporter [Chthonomonadales bacterium]
MTRGRLDLPTTASLIVTLLFWGSAFPFIRIALRAYSPAHLTLFRFLTASAAMLAYALIARTRLPALRDWGPLVGLSFLNVAAYHTLLNYGLVTVGAGAGSLIVNTAPVFAAVFAHRILGEPVDARAWAGLVISLAGAALIALGGGAELKFSPGAALLVGCAITWGLSIVLTKPLLRRFSALQVAMVSVWCGTAMLLVFAPGLREAVRTAPGAATWSIVYLGVFPIAVSYATWSYALSRLPATRVAGYTYTIPVIALAVAFVLLGETPGPLALLGGAVALGGVFLANAGRRSVPA